MAARGFGVPALWPAHAAAQAEPWEDYNKAGVKAFLDGDYAEARRQFAASLGAARRFGPDDPRLAPGLNSLAEVYRDQGEYGNAARLHGQALAIHEKALGPEYPDVAQNFDNLALLYYAQGSYAEAEPLFQMALAIYEKDLGAEHMVEISVTLYRCLHGPEDDHGG